MMDFPKYDSYKDSGIEWLGEIPSHWEVYLGRGYLKQKKVKNIGNAVNTVLSLSYGKIIIKPEEKLHGLVPESFETYQIVTPGDIIVRSTDLQNDRTSLRIGLVENKGIITSAYLCLSPSDKMDSKFTYYLLHSYDLLKVYYGMGSGLRQNLDYTDFKYLPLTVPTIEEQKRIVQFLDRKTAEIDEAIAQKQRLIELLEEQKAILINQAVTKGLNPNVPMKDSGVEWIEKIPEHWSEITIKKVARRGYKTFVDGDWVELPYITEDGIRLIQTGNIGIGEYIDKGFRFIAESSFSRLNCTEVFPRDILVCRLDGPVGRACLAPNLGVRMITSVDNTILKPSKCFDARYIVYLMSSASWLNWIKSICRAGGGFRFRISRSILGNLKIPFPSLEEQSKIANYLDMSLTEFTYCVNDIFKSIEKLNEYRQILIVNTVTGKIKV